MSIKLEKKFTKVKKYRDIFSQLPIRSFQNIAVIVLTSLLYAVGELSLVSDIADPLLQIFNF